MENARQQEFYRKKITELVEKIENPAILEYLYIFIQGKVGRRIEKENKIDWSALETNQSEKWNGATNKNKLDISIDEIDTVQNNQMDE